MRVEDHNGDWRKVSKREKLIFNAVLIYAAFAVAFGSIVAELATDANDLRKRWRKRHARRRN